MKPIDARELPGSTRIDTGICIIGAGVAGITLANELIGSGQEVCLVESGGMRLDEETQSLYQMESIGYPMRQNFMARARYFGGSSNLWAGRSMRLDPIDFERRDWVPHSGWPIGYEEVAGFYPRAERVLDLPDAAGVAAAAARELASGAERALFAQGDLQPKVVMWGRGPMRFQKAYQKRLAMSPNVRILLNANVTEILPAESGTHIESVSAATLGGNRLSIHARQFILACGGLENPRLLLCSRRRTPQGLGNPHDVVGRYFMEHPRAIFGKVRLTVPLAKSLLLGAPLRDGKLQLGVGISDAAQRQQRLLNGYLALEPQMSELTQQAYESSANVVKVLLQKSGPAGPAKGTGPGLPGARDLIYLLTPKEVMPHVLYRGYAGLKSLRQRFRKVNKLTVINFCEQAPRPESRVTLGRIRDRLGMHSLVLDWRIGREETAALVRLQQLLGAQLKREGVGELEDTDLAAVEPRYTDASHHMGTTRMSDDPRQGVVDGDSRVHGIDNLYIAGSSVFPTVGSGNPTLTIVALSLRMADRLKSQA